MHFYSFPVLNKLVLLAQAFKEISTSLPWHTKQQTAVLYAIGQLIGCHSRISGLTLSDSQIVGHPHTLSDIVQVLPCSNQSS